jgi:hypothetical protein
MKKIALTIMLLFVAILSLKAQYGTIVNYSKISPSTSTTLSSQLDNTDFFGTSMDTIGDLNNDGIMDLVVGAPGDDDLGFNTGAVYILLMNSNKTIKSLKKISKNTPTFTNNGINNNDNFGRSVAGIGDINKDGIPDIAVGSEFDFDGGSQTGAIRIIMLDTNGTVKSWQKIGYLSGYGAGGLPLPAGQKFGIAISLVGDNDHDGKKEIVVGNYLDDATGTNSGSVWILEIDSTGKVSTYYKIQNGVTNFTSGPIFNDNFGIGVTGIGDIDNDGNNDIAVGAFEDTEFYNKTGAVYIIKLNSNGSVKSSKKISNAVMGAFYFQVPANRQMGVDVAGLPDIDGNGVNDLLVGNYDNAYSFAGSAYIVFLDSSGNAINYIFINNVSFSQIQNGDRFAYGVSSYVDVDQDGNFEIIAGAPSKDDGGSDKGALYFLSIKSTIPVIIDKSNPSCWNSQNGYIKVTPVGGHPPFTYLWSNNATTDSIGNLVGGNYSVTITDSNNAQHIRQITINNPQKVYLLHSNNYSLCLGNPTTLIAEAFGGTGTNYQYHWSHGLGSDSVHILYPTTTTTYTVFATDNLGCSSDTSSIIITVYPTPSVSALDINTSYCENDTSSITLSGSPAGGIFSGSGVSFNAFKPTLAPVGPVKIVYTYTFIINQLSCDINDTVYTTILGAPMIQFSGLDSTYCSNGTETILSASPSGGLFKINNNPATIFSPSYLGIGNHKISYTVTNSNGCTSTDSLLASVNPVTLGSITGLATSYCNNDNPISINGLPSGGTFQISQGLIGSSFNPTVAGSGNHSISYIYTNEFGCKDTAVKNTTVNASTPVNISTPKIFFCNNDPAINITLSVSGGTLSGQGVNNATQTFNPTAAGVGQKTIFYTYTNSYNCTTTDTLTVTVNSPVNSYFTGLDTSYCSNDNPSVLVGFPAGGTFLGPNMNGNTFMPATSSAGLKTVFYLYDNGCIDTATQTAMVFESPIVNFSIVNTNLCLNGTDINLMASPLGGSFAGSGVLGNIFSPLNAGLGSHTIIYSFTNTQSCSNSDTQIVTVSNSLPINFSNQSTDFCYSNHADTLSALPAGGIWSGNGVISNFFNGVVAGLGNHWLKYYYPYSNGCSSYDSIQIKVHQLPQVSFTGLDLNYCLNSPADILSGMPLGGIFTGNGITGNYFYPNQIGIGSAVISYNYTDSNNCHNTASVAVNVSGLPTPQAGSDTLIPCISNGAQIGVSPTNGYSYFWSPSTGLTSSSIANPIAKPWQTTTYILTVKNLQTNCSNFDSVIISLPPAPVLTITPDMEICKNDTVILTVSGAINYAWSTGSSSNSISVSPTNSTIYSVAGTNDSGCISTGTIFVKVHPSPNPEFVWGSTVNMIGMDSLILYPGSFASYLWSTGDTTPEIIVFPAGAFNLYTVSVIDSNGCKQKDSIYVDIEGIKYIVGWEDVKIFPNPASERVNIEFSKIIEIDQFTIMDNQGRVLQKFDGGNAKQFILNVSAYDNGLYFILMNHSGLNKALPILIKRN